MKRYFGTIKILLLLAGITLLYGFAAHRNSLKEKKDIEVVFNNGDNLFLSYETVNKLLIQNLEGNKNQLKENINLNDLERFLQTNEMVENAEIYLTLYGDLGVIISQSTPVLRVANNSESYYYDRMGLKMPLSDNYSARVPITMDTIFGDSGFDLITLSNRIKNDEFLQKQIIGIDQVGYEEKNQFELETRVGDQKIIFGTLDCMEEKIAKLKVFYRKMLLDSTVQDYKTINLKFRDQIVCEK